MACINSHSEGGAGDDEMVPCSPLGGERGERKVAATLGTNIIAGVVNNSYILTPCCPPGRRGCRNLTSQSAHGSSGVLREVQRGAHPLTTIDPALLLIRQPFVSQKDAHSGLFLLR